MRYYIIGGDGMEYGPAPYTILRQWRSEGRLNESTRIRAESETSWEVLGEVWESLPVEEEPEVQAHLAADAGAAVADKAFPVHGMTRPVPEKLDPFYCLQRSFDLLRSNFYRLVAGTFLFTLLLFLIQLPDLYLSIKMDSGAEDAGNLSTEMMGIRSLSVFLTSMLSILLGAPLMGGLYRFYLKHIRGESPAIREIFGGFQIHLLQLVLCGMVSGLLTAIGFFFFIAPGVYLMVSWVFSFAVIIDQDMNYWDAMETSRRMLMGNWWRMALLLLIGALISILGVLLLGVGIVLTQPILFGSIAYAYEDLRGFYRKR